MEWIFKYKMQSTLADIVNQLLDLTPTQQATITKSEQGIYLLEVIDTIDNKELPYVELKIVPSDREYNIVHVTKETRGLFPGYKVQFVLETDLKPFVMHLTGGNNGNKIGEEEGGYICHPRPTEVEKRFLQIVPDANTKEGSFKQFYDAHPKLQPENYVKVFRVNKELYRLTA